MLYIKRILFLVTMLACQFAVAGAYEDMMDAVKRDDTRTIDALLKRGLDANTSDQEGNTLLILAVREGSEKAAKRLVAARARVNARNSLGESALMLAALRGQLEIVRELVDNGADVNSPGWTALMYAAVNGHVDVSRLLISKGAQVNAVADNGFTALMMAVREGHAALVSLLLANGADPELKTASGLTALDLAREKKRPAIVDALVKAGVR